MPTPLRSIDVVEASYRFDQSERDWLCGLLQATRKAQPVPNLGAIAAGFIFEATDTGESFRPASYAMVNGSADVLAALRSFHSSLTPDTVQRLFWKQPVLCATLSQIGMPVSPEQQVLGVKDLLGLQAIDASGAGFCLLFELPREVALRSPMQRHWDSVTHHMRAALRLRRSLASGGFGRQIEAVIDPADGQVVHAGRLTASRDARALLRHIALSIDRGRTRQRRQDGEAALGAWPALLGGRLTIIEHFDGDGRRYYVALRNEPGAQVRVKLSQRERQVAERVAAGIANKVIADELGISEVAAGAFLNRAMAKLGVDSRSELVALAGELEEFLVPVGHDTLMVMRAGDDLENRLASLGLTKSEQSVAIGLLRGQSYSDIAASRDRHVRTVANQVQSVFRKVGVSSRTELVAELTRPA